METKAPSRTSISSSSSPKPTPAGASRRRSPATILLWVAIAWSLFQLWYASPLPFVLRHRHPQRHRGARDPSRLRAVPRLHGLSGVQVVAARLHPDTRLGAGGRWRLRGRLPRSCSIASWRCAPATPTMFDLVTAGVGILLLLEATRRSLGLPMVFVARVLHPVHLRRPYMPEADAAQGRLARALPRPSVARRPRACSASRSASRPASCSCSCCSARCSTRPAAATG